MAIASANAPLWRAKPCRSTGNAVNHAEAPSHLPLAQFFADLLAVHVSETLLHLPVLSFVLLSAHVSVDVAQILFWVAYLLAPESPLLAVGR